WGGIGEDRVRGDGARGFGSVAAHLDGPEEGGENFLQTVILERFVGLTDLALQQQYAACPEFDIQMPILVLESHRTFGRTANRLRSFQNAIQYTRDNQYQLGIMHNSWPMDIVLQFFMANGEDAWDSQVIEAALCVKIIHKLEELKGRKFQLARKKCCKSIAYTVYMFQHYNTGDGHDHHGKQVGNMCSGIDSLFGQKDRTSAVYSVIHLRHMEGGGGKFMKVQAAFSGWDPLGALEMSPDYIKSILAPLDMLKHHIVVITLMGKICRLCRDSRPSITWSLLDRR
ncbi:hypothetical protein ACHAXR_003966, partial [Thalassiosira sp. AJA248-18]